MSLSSSNLETWIDTFSIIIQCYLFIITKGTLLSLLLFCSGDHTKFKWFTAFFLGFFSNPKFWAHEKCIDFYQPRQENRIQGLKNDPQDIFEKRRAFLPSSKSMCLQIYRGHKFKTKTKRSEKAVGQIMVRLNLRKNWQDFRPRIVLFPTVCGQSTTDNW